MKYRYAVQYKDGTVFTQPPDDKSVQDPAKSAWHDVDTEQVGKFSVYASDWEAEVHLEEGVLTLNGIKIRNPFDTNKKRSLIYFKRNKHILSERGSNSHEQRCALGWKQEEAEDFVILLE